MLNNGTLRVRVSERDQEIRALSRFPSFIYGAGVYARELTDFLKFYGIEVEGFIVDDNFLGNSNSTNSSIYRFSDIIKLPRKINIFIGICKNPEAQIKKINEQRIKNINDIITIDCRFWRRFRELRDNHTNSYFSLTETFNLFDDDVSKSVFSNYLTSKFMYTQSNLAPFYNRDHYFPGDIKGFALNRNEVFIDCGAFTGDTLQDFIWRAGKNGFQKYYAFEPDSENYKTLLERISREKILNVTTFNLGVWSSKKRLSFSESSGSTSCIVAKGQSDISVDKIDNFLLSPSYIKMDIEGSELEALRGASETILRSNPKLAIAVYHKPDDLILIPKFIKSLNSSYKFALRIHRYFSEELVLYAYV